jgi:hypothetical protein
MMTSEIRNANLAALSQMIIGNEITYKLDQIATIHINSRHYFNVFRRYNSTYNIVIEDGNGDTYLHQDHTVRKSLETILCLPQWEAAHIYTWTAFSYKHNGPVPSLSSDIADMRWTEIQANYQAVSVNFGGIFNDRSQSLTFEEPPTTPVNQICYTPTTPPDAPTRLTQATQASQASQPISDMEAANILLSFSMPKVECPYVENPFALRESDGPTMSMRFADVRRRIQGAKHISCHCNMNSDDDEEEDAYEDTDEEINNENNYTVLRSGTYIPKPFVQ